MKKIVIPEDDKIADLYRVYVYREDSSDDGKDFYYEDYHMALVKAEFYHRRSFSVVVYKNENIDCEYEQ